MVLSVQVTEFQVSEVVREGTWKSLGKACAKNMPGIMHEEY